jgi:hypothetical protein
MLDVANGDGLDGGLQGFTEACVELVHLLLDKGVQDGFLEVGFKAPFGEVENYRGARTRGPISPLRIVL